MFEKMKTYVLFVSGILMGIAIVSMIRDGEINWTIMNRTFVLSIFLHFSLLLIHKGRESVDNE